MFCVVKHQRSPPATKRRGGFRQRPGSFGREPRAQGSTIGPRRVTRPWPPVRAGALPCTTVLDRGGCPLWDNRATLRERFPSGSAVLPCISPARQGSTVVRMLRFVPAELPCEGLAAPRRPPQSQPGYPVTVSPDAEPLRGAPPSSLLPFVLESTPQASSLQSPPRNEAPGRTAVPRAGRPRHSRATLHPGLGKRENRRDETRPRCGTLPAGRRSSK